MSEEVDVEEEENGKEKKAKDINTDEEEKLPEEPHTASITVSRLWMSGVETLELVENRIDS